jgi:hypothetical protein
MWAISAVVPRIIEAPAGDSGRLRQAGIRARSGRSRPSRAGAHEPALDAGGVLFEPLAVERLDQQDVIELGGLRLRAERAFGVCGSPSPSRARRGALAVTPSAVEQFERA